MLCGEPPFVAIGLGEVLMMHMNAAPLPPSQRRPDVPADLEAVAHKALAKQPEERFASMAEFAAALRATQGFPASVPGRLDDPTRITLSVRGSSPEQADRPDTMPTVIAASPKTGPEVFQATALQDVSSLKPVTQEPPRRVSKRSLAITGVLSALAVSGAVLVVVARQSQQVHVLESRHRPALGDIELRHTADPPPSRLADSAPILQPAAAKANMPTRVAPRSHSAGIAAAPATSSESALAASERSGSVTNQATGSGGASDPSQAAAPGYLSLDSSPWANVSVAGRSLGVTPLRRIALPPGRYVLKLENPELRKTTSYVVDVQSGRAVSRFVGWGNE